MTEERIKELEEYALMLGRIASLVGEFCDDGETTLEGVAKLLALYRDCQARDAWEFVDGLHRASKI